MVNTNELATGVHVNFESIIEKDGGKTLSGDRKKAYVKEIIDENNLVLIVDGQETDASSDQIFPIPLTDELLLSIMLRKLKGGTLLFIGWNNSGLLSREVLQ